jgi:thiopeptide-type bacteriocin biosynthesis protein
MPFLIAKYLLVRMPVKKPVDYANGLQAFLDDMEFRAALLIATPLFYTRLERHNFSLSELSSKEQLTLQKYMNRYCFRPTPFGLFASVHLGEFNKETFRSPNPPVYWVYTQADMTFQQYVESHYLIKYQSFENNPSTYKVLNEFRFIKTVVNEKEGIRDYQLQSIGYTTLLKGLVKLCRIERTWEEIVLYIREAASCTLEEAKDYGQFLADSQFLVPTLRLNIAGDDYMQRIIGYAGPDHSKNFLFKTYSEITANKAEVRLPFPADVLKKQEVLNGLISPQPDIQPFQLNVILQRSGNHEMPGKVIQDKLLRALTALDLLSPPEQLPAMANFISSFLEQFDGQTVPLLKALDPEVGIGYQTPETENPNPLLETLNIQHKVMPDHTVIWSSVHALLLETWLKDRSPTAVIRLEYSDLEHLKRESQLKQITGMSILFRLIEDQVLIETAGGTNGPALIGRFTVIDQGIQSAAKAMAQSIEEQNPELIFAELLHLADPHTDNVNRRTHIYQYEIPITASSTLPENFQIDLSDLYLSVKDNVAVLFSRKHQKLVIPRLSTAYNHTLNKLPLFRFLADLPYQYGRHKLSFELRQYFPDLKFYPRVQIEDTIISLAMWIIDSEKAASLQVTRDDLLLQNFRLFSEELNLPRYFTLSEGDQELVFDQSVDNEILFFCGCIRRKKQVTIKEHLSQPTIRQYNAYLLPAEKLSLPKPIFHFHGKVTKDRKLIPGSEWLYLKIYTPTLAANRLLLQLRPLLQKKYGQYKVKQWFFIRYQDPAPHIRLRLMIAPQAISEILLAFKSKIETPIQQHVIREYQINTYNRELERYAAAGIEVTEQFFYASSELVMDFLHQSKKELSADVHIFALYTMANMISVFLVNTDDQITFTLGSFEQFETEFAAGKVKAELDRKYRQLATGIENTFQAGNDGLLSGSTIAAQRFLVSLKAAKQKTVTNSVSEKAYLRSIIHMHLNRIFTDQSRKQEMACYYFLYKKFLSDKFRKSSHRSGSA